MSVIPCAHDVELKRRIDEFAEALKVEAHLIGSHGLAEKDFYDSGILLAAVERLRGQNAATMRAKREFVRLVLNYMQDQGYIREWESAGSRNRHDYTVTMPNGRISVIELKGCLDGNNTNIFERPPNAHEFIIWSICPRSGSDPQKNVWSGIHTRLSAEIIDKEKQVDGLIVWDWVCGTPDRPCPKLSLRTLDPQSVEDCEDMDRRTAVGQHFLTPPCIYLFPSTVPSVRNNPSPEPYDINDVRILKAFADCFKGINDELNYVRFSVENRGAELLRTTSVKRDGAVRRASRATPIRRK